MTSDVIELVDFGPEHIEGGHALSMQVEWPHRPEDWALLLALGRGIAAVEAGRVVGTAMVTPYGTTVATINTVIVAESLRGRGLGRRLMDAALAACAGRECRLVATADGLPLYEKLGFRATHEIRQHQGRLAPAPGIATLPKGADIAWTGQGGPVGSDLATLVAADRAACGMDRHELVGALGRVGRVAILRRDGAVAGFAGLRDFGRGEVVGPVVAAEEDDARALIAHAFTGRAGRFMRVDIPDSVGLAPWLEAQGLVHVGGGIAMTRPARGVEAASSSTPPFKTYALASQALG